MKKALLLFFIAFLGMVTAKAQLIESFDGVAFPPAGWTTTVISVGDGGQNSPGMVWDRVTTSNESPVDPAINPHSGAGMARYDAYDFDSLSKADLITPAMDFTGGPERLSFWMYRSATYQTEDSLTVYINTSASSTGATFLGTIVRVRNRPPVVSTIGWYKYTVDLPASFNGASNYIIFRGSGEYGLSLLIDDVVVTSCFPPAGIAGSNYNYAAGTATVTWTPISGSPGYQWALNTTGIAPASGTAVTTNTISVTGITSGVVNYLFVRSACGSGGFSEWDTLKIAGLPCATIVAPANGAVNTPQNQSFSWTAVPGATSYRFYLGNTAGNEFYIGNVTGTTATISNLIPSTNYSWYIIPVIGQAPALNSCTSNTFTIAAEGTTPANNPCSGAITINSDNTAANPVAGTTLGATLTRPANICNGLQGGIADDDVWYQFTTSAEAPPSGTLTITPIASRGITDIVAQVYTAASCDDITTPVLCADQTDAANSEIVNLAGLSPNTHYYMRIYSYDSAILARGGFTIVASAGNTLPVNLGSFSARRSNGINLLAWSTQQEINTSSFVVERGNDGRNFTAIGTVGARGGNQVNNYYFSDIHPAKGINYYRLRINDNNNSSKLSATRSVRNEGIANISLYPNPVTNKLTVLIDADKASQGHLVITDMSGKAVYSRTQQFPQGSTQLPVLLNNLAAGSYLLKIQLNDDVIIKKFNKQ